MNPATRKFAYDIINHVLQLHCPEGERSIASNDSTVDNAPVLYNKVGHNLVQNYITYNKEFIKAFCSTVCGGKKLGKLAICNRADGLIYDSRHYDQCFEVLYNLCIKLTLLSFVALERGYADAMQCAVEKINTVATEAYNRGDLDENFDNMFNFVYDLLLCVFGWIGCDIKFQWDLKRLEISSNSLDYFALIESYSKNFILRNGNTILNHFSSVGSKLENMSKEVFLFQIQDWCDAYYGQIGELETPISLEDLLEIFLNISLLTVHAVGLLYPCSIRLAHESMIKLAISAERKGMFTIAKCKKLVIRSLKEV